MEQWLRWNYNKKAIWAKTLADDDAPSGKNNHDNSYSQIVVNPG